jgi:phosphomannomutase
MNIDPSIFKAYDIRGIYPTNLNEEIAYRIGRAYSKIIKKENIGQTDKIVVANDMRLSTPNLKKSLIKGLLDSGVDILDIGLATTPTFYFAVAYFGFKGGIQVSASHNPKEYNGFKIVRAKSVPFSSETGINHIRDLVIKNVFLAVAKKGKLTKKNDVLGKLIEIQSKGINLKSINKFKIAVDAANAMGAIDMNALFKILPCKLIKLNFKLDGSFPVHQPDPLAEENLKYLQEKVLKHHADFGISIDGDGDRYFLIDEKGEIIRQEILRGIMAQIAIKENPKATVCYDIRPGRITKDMIDEVGGKAVVTRVGHSLIKEKMLETKAVFGGESSGHYFYKFPFGTFEAPIVLVLKFLVYLSKQNKPLSEVVKTYKKYFHSGEINSEVRDKDTKIKEIARKYSNAEISYLDGITIIYPDFWFNVRPSNTENLLRLNLEAVSQKLMEKKRDEVLKFIRSENE